jgi:hypothetical protein
MSTTTVSRATTCTIGEYISELKSGKQLRMSPTNSDLLFQYIRDYERGMTLVVVFCEDGKTLFKQA